MRLDLAERCYATAHAALLGEDERGALGLFWLLALLAPREARAWVGLAACSERLGRDEAALGLYRLGASLARERAALCHLGRARALRRLGREAEASDAFDDADAVSDDAALSAKIRRERTLQ